MTTSEPRRPSAGTPSAAIDWPAVLAAHDRWLRTVVAARLGEPQAIDEVMQEISLAVVAQKAPLNDPEKLAPWLYRLAVMQTLMYRRKLGRRRKLADRYQQLRSAEEPVAADPLQWLLLKERDQLIRQAIRQLSPRDAEILMLKYSENWSYREMAEHLGLSESAIEARLHRARQRLRDRLSALGVIEVSR